MQTSLLPSTQRTVVCSEAELGLSAIFDRGFGYGQDIRGFPDPAHGKKHLATSIFVLLHG